ncbi:hypothetical protein F5Y10DRAFT_292416 [Nemania abortiva]|nr:hypothetical protein F5Y10DRAFT_292416 [Nemania abortiva]
MRLLGMPNSGQVIDRTRSPTSALISESAVPRNITTPEDGRDATTGPKSLWDLAYEALREEKPGVVESYEELLFKTLPYLRKASSTINLEKSLSESPLDPASLAPKFDTETQEVAARSLASRKKMMEDVIKLGQRHMGEKQIAFQIGQQKFVLQDQMRYVVAGVQAGKDWINEAVKASPLASAAWAGVCLFLPLLTNPSDVQAANEEGLAYVIQKIRYYTSMESHFLYGQDGEVLPSAEGQYYKERIVKLYQAIIDFQAQSVSRFFRRRFGNFLRDTVKWDSWEEMLKRIRELGDSLERESVQINAALIREELGGIARWAQQSGEDICLQNRLEVRVPDTCLWFLNHASYHSWLEADSGPLLVSADPGCGKSVLAKYLIESNFGFRVPKDAAICYFFFKEGDQNTIDLAFCALIHQLLCLRPQLMRHALPRFKQDGENLSNNVTALWDILQSAAADSEAGAIIIVLDALDECIQDESNMATLSRYVRTHFEQGPKNLKILMTSRPYQNTVQHIQELEESFPNIRIKGEDESETLREEINSVIEYRVSRVKKFDDGLKAHLKQRLLAITHRTYLWLYLVFEYLGNTTIKSTRQGLDKAIEFLPATVEDAYEKILSRSTEPEKTKKAILILLAAYRPLTLDEMQVALDMTLGNISPENLDLEPNDKFKLRLRELCGLFITVHDNKVYYLHQTAREFLLPLSPSANSTTITAWAHKFSIREAHAVLAESCIACLDLYNSPTGVSTKADFLGYSAEYWDGHFREADISDDAAIVPFASRISDLDSKAYPLWSRTNKQLYSPYVTGGSGSLMVASYLGHEAVVKLLLNTGQIDANQTAAMAGHGVIVKLLLTLSEIDVNLVDEGGQTPLSCAATNGHEAVVKLLLNSSNVNVNLRDKYGRTPFFCAVEYGNEAVITKAKHHSASPQRLGTKL